MLCVDELGPLGAKIYPAHRWCPAGQAPGYQPNYGKRGAVWVFGAFEPRTGQALTVTSDQRRRFDFIEFLDQLIQSWPEGEVSLIMDNLAVHKTMEVRLWALQHPRVRFLFQPRYAPWLNLIEPCWKTLKGWALKGRNFETRDAVKPAIVQATAYWNSHRHPYTWRKAA